MRSSQKNPSTTLKLETGKKSSSISSPKSSSITYPKSSPKSLPKSTPKSLPKSSQNQQKQTTPTKKQARPM